MLGRDEVDIVDATHVLQLDIPVRELLRRYVEAIALMGNGVILTEHLHETRDVSRRVELLAMLRTSQSIPSCLVPQRTLPPISLTYTSEIAPREEHTSIAITSLYARLLSEVRRDGVDHNISSYQASSTAFEPIDTTKARAEVAVSEMGIGFASLSGLLLGCK